MVGLSVVCCSAVVVLIRGGMAQVHSDSRSATLDKDAEAPLASAPSLDALCHQIQEEGKPVDALALNLVIAREIPSLRSLDVSKYQRVLDSWADHVRKEVQRNLHRSQIKAYEKNSAVPGPHGRSARKEY